MVDEINVGISRIGSKAADKRIGIAVGNLQADTQEHGENEKQRHLLLSEQPESIQSERFADSLFADSGVGRAGRQRKGIATQQHTPHGRNPELRIGMLQLQEVYHPHGNDEPDGAEDSDRRESLDRIQSGLFQRVVGNGIRQCQGRHIESDAERVPREDLRESHIAAHGKADVSHRQHAGGSQKMAIGQQALGLHPAVGHDADQPGHKDRHNTLHRIKPADVVTDTDR